MPGGSRQLTISKELPDNVPAMSTRLSSLILTVALLLAACGAGDAPAAGDAAATSATTVAGPSVTAAPSAPSTSAASPTDPPASGDPADRPAIDGPAAPDFTLALADGSTFVLSEADKPVYLVFWAEW